MRARLTAELSLVKQGGFSQRGEKPVTFPVSQQPTSVSCEQLLPSGEGTGVLSREEGP